MIFLDYNKIIITPDYKNYNILRRELIKIYLEKNIPYFSFLEMVNEKTKYNLPDIDEQVNYLNRGLRNRSYDKCDSLYRLFYLYELDDNGNMIIPIGYLDFIKNYLDMNQLKVTYDIKSPLVNTKTVLEKVNENLLPNIILREQQVEAIRRSLILKRTIIQLPTGGGKSEVMCGIIEALRQVLGYIPTTLLLEPTDKLKKEMIERFNKYNIDAVDYNKKREILENKINVSHPASLNNDLSKDNNILNKVKVYLCDETHHSQSVSYNATAINVPNSEYMIGVSASAVGQDHVNSKNIQDYTVEELKAISMMGLVSYNVTAKEMIEAGKLSEPVLLVVNSLANEKIPKNKQSDWHTISKVRLQSDTRIGYIAKCASYFSKEKRKSLILINNKEWAYRICKEIYNCGYGEECRLSFGGQIFLKYDSTTDEFVKDKETFEKFHTGEVSILIGTQHLVEGVDIPSLDCVILPAVGKSERIQIQSCGRALRLTKNGNMAYIIDFSDEIDPILNHQFKTRLSTYLNTIGVKSDHVHVLDRNDIDKSLAFVFNKYEN